IRALTEDEDVEGGIFVVTGGLGGLGRELLRWLAQRGAKKLGVIDVISEEQLDEQSPAKKALLGLRLHGVQVIVVKTDVKDYDACNASIKKIREFFHCGIRGVFHLAGILEDQLLSKLTREAFIRVCEPKIEGGWNLHEATLEDSENGTLRYFVLFSSVAGILGQPGQGNYATANGFLNAASIYLIVSIPIPCASVALVNSLFLAIIPVPPSGPQLAQVTGRPQLLLYQARPLRKPLAVAQLPCPGQ
ncbi:MAG: putative type I polyketide synthase, partial [Streblomastix strix]